MEVMKERILRGADPGKPRFGGGGHTLAVSLPAASHQLQ